MQRFRLLGLTLLAAFAFVAALSATASANPSILPTPSETEPLTFTSTGGLSKLVAAAGVIECESLTNSGEFTSVDLGVVHIHFLGCKALPSKSKCKTGIDTNGQILLSADIHLVDLLPGGVLTLGAAIILLENVMITCGVGKIEVKGTVLGPIDGPKTLVKTKTGKLLLHASGGKQEFKECDELVSFCFEGANHKKFELLSKFTAEEAFKEGIEETEDDITLAKEVEFHF